MENMLNFDPTYVQQCDLICLYFEVVDVYKTFSKIKFFERKQRLIHNNTFLKQNKICFFELYGLAQIHQI